MKTKIAVLGAAGMLGHMVRALFEGNPDFDVVVTARNTLDVFPRKLNDLGSKLTTLLGYDVDYVVNCIGAIKPTFTKANDPTIPIYTNAVFPHQLSTWCELTSTRLIHITTDCVFDGQRGQYTELDPHNALDIYGKSKSLGEPEKAMVLRTSIIGPELGGRRRSLLEWVKSEDGNIIHGFTEHLWNGVTTLELAHMIFDLIESDIYSHATFHLFSETISKHDLLNKIIKAYGLNIEVCPKETSRVDRTLDTVNELNNTLQPAELDKMLKELVKFEGKLR